MARLGKRVLDDLYVHLSFLPELDDETHRAALAAAVQSVPADHPYFPNVGKLNLRTGGLSLLCYPSFEHAPFPELAASWVFRSGPQATPELRLYTHSLNPPILHRKELLVPAEHPLRQAWEVVTSTAESLGLFEGTSTIGFKLNWERKVESRGFKLDGQQFLPLGNAEDANGQEDRTTTMAVGVARHLTALTRTSLSAPVQLLLRHELLTDSSSFFDYGCGRGGDVATLRASGIIANGWDPHYAPDERLQSADVINLGFVVNVIDDPAERVDALRKAFALATRVLAVSVMLEGSGSGGVPFSDGVLTSRQTFQKYFTQAELKDFVEHALNETAFMVAPGVAYVFVDRDAEQRFIAGRVRSKGVAARALRVATLWTDQERARPAERARRAGTSRASQRFSEARPHLDRLWAIALDLGRLPEEADVECPSLIHDAGGLTRACRLLNLHYDAEALRAAASMRRDDFTLVFVQQLLSKRTPFRKLEPRLQRDVRAFFGDYSRALEAARELLVSASDASNVLEACKRSAELGLGWLEEEKSLLLHIDLVERLPAVLRAYVLCGLVLWDNTSNVQLIKIHIASGKLTLLEFDDFDSTPVPLLRRRVKVGLRRLSCEVFDYGTPQHPKPPLLYKSRYLHEDYPGYAEQTAFDERLAKLSISPDTSLEEFKASLRRHRLEVSNGELLPSKSVPDLDEPCGVNFTFRSFVECGETQRHSKIPNIPRSPETYNALYLLATEILDPVIEYFGAVKLTYGVCCLQLMRLITRRVAPALDQHASHEVNAKGMRICRRDGAACDFIVEDEDMFEVAQWISANLPFDRMYFYGANRPLHVSFGPAHSRALYEMRMTASGHLMPTPMRP